MMQEIVSNTKSNYKVKEKQYVAQLVQWNKQTQPLAQQYYTAD